jgi:hypothetical protein
MASRYQCPRRIPSQVPRRHPRRLYNARFTLAHERPGSRNGVVGRLRPVHLERDAWIGTRICAGQAHVFGRESCCPAGQVSSGYITALPSAAATDVDLGAFHVELCAWVAGCRVQRDDLGAKKVSISLVSYQE